MSGRSRPDSSPRRWVFFALVAVGLSVAVGVLALFIFAGVKPSEPVQKASKPLPPSAYQAALALAALPGDPLNGVAAAMRNVVAADLEGAIPPGSEISADPATWIPIGDRAGTIAMSMSVPGESEPRLYLAYLVLEDGQWKLAMTYEALE